MNPLRKLYRSSSKFLLTALGLHIINYNNNVLKHDRALIKLLTDLRIEGTAFQSFEELHNIYRFSKSVSALPGAYAEVGVYKGGTALLLGRHKGVKTLQLFDSFEGMKTSSEHDIHLAGDFDNTSLEQVRRYLQGIENVEFYKGWFPETTKGLENTTYAFVHLDVDLYQSTKDALEFFYPRLTSGGMILSHDFNSLSCPGVSKAFLEFFEGKAERPVELAGTTQCLVIKK